jgi:hypothetical protein
MSSFSTHSHFSYLPNYEGMGSFSTSVALRGKTTNIPKALKYQSPYLIHMKSIGASARFSHGDKKKITFNLIRSGGADALKTFFCQSQVNKIMRWEFFSDFWRL